MVQLIIQMLGSPSEEDIFFPENENRVCCISSCAPCAQGFCLLIDDTRRLTQSQYPVNSGSPEEVVPVVQCSAPTDPHALHSHPQHVNLPKLFFSPTGM